MIDKGGWDHRIPSPHDDWEPSSSGTPREDSLEEVVQEKKEKAIANPWFSRPLDVHRWSDHAELVAVVDQVWNEHCSDFDRSRGGGPKPKCAFRGQLRILLLDLYVAWLENPNLSIGVAMSQNSWDAWSRYNKLGISKKIVQLIHRLVERGLIDEAKGSYSGPYAPGNRTTRIRAAEPLRAMFRELQTSRNDVHQVVGQECIILKAGDGEEAKYQEYDDTEETLRMRAELEAYNTLIADSFIDIPTLSDPWITRSDKFGKEARVPINHHHQFTRRIFSRGSWKLNGRFYGPWWQQVGKELRERIFINNRPTVEVDFKGLHLAIIAAKQGVRVVDDPYELPSRTVPDVDKRQQREIVKQLVLTALNARTEKAAFSSFRDGWPAGHRAKGLTNKELSCLLSLFSEKNPWAKSSLGADVGIGLMNLDLQIAERVLGHFTRKGIPVLCIHDSFIIDYGYAGELRAVMAEASEAVVGKPLALDGKAGLDDYLSDSPRYIVRDYVGYKRRGCCEAYRDRRRAWEALKGRRVGARRRNEVS